MSEDLIKEISERIGKRLEIERNAPDFELIIPTDVDLNKMDGLRLTDMYDYVIAAKDVTVFNSYIYTLDVFIPFKKIGDEKRRNSTYYTACCLFKLNGVESKYDIAKWFLENDFCETPFTLTELAGIIDKAATNFESVLYRYTKRKMIFGRYCMMNGKEKQMYSGEIMGTVRKDKRMEQIRPHYMQGMTQRDFYNTLIKAGIKISLKTVKRYLKEDKNGDLVLVKPPKAKSTKRYLKAA